MANTKTRLGVIIDLLFPPRCVFCDAVLPRGRQCAACAEQTEKLRLGESARKDHLRAERALGDVDMTISCYIYGGAAAESVQRLKFASRPDLAPLMAAIMAADVEDEIVDAAQWVAVGVPSYKNRSDHSQLLAKHAAKRLGIRYAADALIKTHRTQKQHDLDADARAENLRGSFEIKNAEAVRGKRVLLCDDVMTSGNTLNECAKALKQAGAAFVLGLCFTSTAPDFKQQPR